MTKQEIRQWTLYMDGFPALSDTAPCSMYSVLLKNKQISDPFDRDNEAAATALSRRDCAFTAEFMLSPAELAHEHLQLRFDGLDTLADVRLNGQLLGSADNMHRTWVFDIRAAARAGQNELRVDFHSPFNEMERRQAAHYVQGDANSANGIAHLRKSFCMSGWDWAPTLPDMGFYRPVWIEIWDGARIDDLLLHQEHTESGVELTATLTRSQPSDDEAELIVTTPEGHAQCVPFVNGKATLHIANPQLWWPNGLGDHPLYTVESVLRANGKETDRCTKRIGLRTLTVSRAKDDFGEEFCFVVNGVKFFAMGADYIPEDSILARLTPARTERLIRSCAAAHFNSLRVWGGAFYPNDWVFDLCDEYGLVVWQDFMFACIDVWMNPAFTENVRAEAIENVRRLRHHACLGLLCGNNENELSVVEKWGRANADAAQLEQIRADYLELYEKLLPAVCAEYAPDVFYWPASPSSGGGFDNPNDEHRGDVHYWGAWHGSIPFESYRQYQFRFCSEFGFESFPAMKTIESFARPEDRNPFSWVMEHHQKCKGGNKKILSYLADYYLYPDSFAHLVYASQLLQADAIRCGVEHFRRFRGRCMGAIYWQLNDCWPVASWASVDYFGRWKALHYAARRFFAPVLLSAHENGTHVVLNVSNEQRTPLVGTLQIALRRSDFSVIASRTLPVQVDALAALDVDDTDYGAQLTGLERDAYLEYTILDASGTRISGGTLLFVRPKFFRFGSPQLHASIAGENGRFTLTVNAQCYARAVEISFEHTDAQLSDNYFDISRPDSVTITVEVDNPAVTAAQLQQELRLQSVQSIAALPQAE